MVWRCSRCNDAGAVDIFLGAGQVPEMATEPIRLGFHLAAEYVTALSLIVGGGALLKHQAWGAIVYMVACGMLLYSEIVSPGYFAQQGQWVLVGMFAILFLPALVSLRQLTPISSSTR